MYVLAIAVFHIPRRLNVVKNQAKQLRKRITSALRRAADAHHATIDLEMARVLQRREPKEARLLLGLLTGEHDAQQNLQDSSISI